ncbi:hypothetical protein F5148DRAFT_1183471 [Russula earlei]|uniref:Uncharacterized protein n=1 Tax=Russula earlei TaxID=71964 RepID=A0ACC0UGI6_9AGAM|nr:hypothetical protein F5148DRAFT_1183471 [Russula earlei]
MATGFSPTQGEVALVNQIFNKHDPQKFGVITGELAVNIFGGANLSATVLGQIWGIADADQQGFLTRKGVSVAVRLIGWAQKGEAISPDLVNKPGPLASIDGFSLSAEPRRAVSPSPKSPGASRLPPQLTAPDKARFTRLFNSCSPVNGLLSGEKAREVFFKSKLSIEKLSQIWSLSDTHSRGSLDVADFIVAMYLIQASMSGQLPFIPTTLPPGLYESASDQPLRSSTVTSHATGTSGSFSPSLSGNFPPNIGPGIAPQFSGKPLQPQYSGLTQSQTGPKSGPDPTRNSQASSSFPPFSAVQPQPAWGISPTEKASADRLFDSLDTQKLGYLESDVAVPFMLRSNLPEDNLALIWDLADLNTEGRLTRDGFAVAFHLIQGKLSGKEIPSTLPTSLIPPSMRAVASPTTSAFQQPPSDSLNDLLWDDSPVVSHPQSVLQPQRTGLTQSSVISASQAAPQTQGQGPFTSNKGPLDDDDDAGVRASSTTINDHSAEIGNLQNQLQSTTRSLENTKTERSTIEATVHSQAAQLSALQTQLSSAKAAYEAESGHLVSLRERLSNQSSEIQRIREELIRAESDLSAIRLEKAEVEQSLLHDKEEVRELQHKMTETGSTIEVTRVEIEKAKKEAKQQKGLLAIAKKQLAAREAERVKAAQELQEAAAEAAEATKEREIAEAEYSAVNKANGLPFSPSPPFPADSAAFAAAQPLPATPGSPSSIGGSAASKSNNPFERLAVGSRSQSPFLPFADAPVPAPAAVTSAQNEGTTDDNPFTFDQAFGGEETRPGSDVEESSTVPERNVPPFIAKDIGESRTTANEEVSEPSSDHDLFTTPPTSALDNLASANTFSTAPDALRSPPVASPSAAPSTVQPLEVHTDINSKLKELDVNDSDSSDEDSEDETPLATLAGRSAQASNSTEVKRAPVSNGHASHQTTVGAAFPPVTKIAAVTEIQSTNPFPPAPPKDSSAFPTATSPFAVSPEPPTVAALSDIDKAFGEFGGTASTTTGNSLSFDTAFDDQFDFNKADLSTSLPSSGLPATSPPQGSGFENAFIPPQSTASPGPVPAVDGLPVLPPVLESKPFSFEQAFTNLSPAAPLATAAANTAASQPPSNADATNPSFDDAFGSNSIRRDSALGTVSSQTSSIPQMTQSPVSTSAFASSSPVRTSISPRDTVSFPAPEGTPPSSPPLQMASPPKGRPSTSSSKESGKESGRSKLSIRLPFGKKRKTQESLPPSASQHLAPIVDETVGRASPAVDDDVDLVKQLRSMGFSRQQAVAALEANSYDFSRALNSLLNS